MPPKTRDQPTNGTTSISSAALESEHFPFSTHRFKTQPLVRDLALGYNNRIAALQGFGQAEIGDLTLTSSRDKNVPACDIRVDDVHRGNVRQALH